MNTLNRVPPQNLEAEQSVLGAILLDNDSLLVAADLIDSSDFYREAHKTIFNAFLDIYQDGGSIIDLITLSERLKTKGSLEQIGGITYLSNLFNLVPTAANIRIHAKIVKDKSFHRRTIKQLSLLLNEAQEDIEDPTDFLRKIEWELMELAQTVQEKQDPHVGSIISDVKKRWQEEKDGMKSFISVDYKLNSAIPRYIPGHLWAVAGYTSVGKSTFVAQQIVDACEKQAKCMIFSLEDSREEKLIKILANQADISQKRLMLGYIEGYENKIAKASEEIKKWSLLIYDDIYTIDGMRLKMKKHKLQDGLDIVFIDYIQNIQGEGFRSLYDRLSDGVVALQKMAKELQVTIIFISQVTNESMKANSELIGLKGAGELASTPDIVLWLSRFKREENKAKERYLDCEIRKNRPFGETGKYPLMFSDNWARIEKRF